MTLNILTLVACLGLAAVVSLLVGVLFSARVRRHGVLGSLRDQFSAASRFNSPYKG